MESISASLTDASAWVALTTAAVLCLVSGAVVVVYSRYIRRPAPGAERAEWLAHGACVGFLAAGMTAAWWGSKWVFVLMGMDHAAAFISSYGGFLDPVVRGLSIWAGIAHLRAAGVPARLWAWLARKGA